VAGLAGWQWLFLLEGIPAVILGFAVWFYLTDRPELAHWLEPVERTWLARRLMREEVHRQQRHGLVTLLGALNYPRVWLLIALYFTVAVGTNAFGFYLPKLIKEHFTDQSPSAIGFLAALPPLAAIFAMVLVGVHSDRTGERRWHVAGPAFLAAVGWVLAAWLDSPGLFLAALALTQMGMMSMLGPFWALPTSFLSGVAAAGGIALINSLANLGGFVGPQVLGQSMELTGRYTVGFLVLAATMLVGGVLALCVRHEATLDKMAPRE
jgi:ACS family tartrate transporter-like MFS transporter